MVIGFEEPEQGLLRVLGCSQTTGVGASQQILRRRVPLFRRSLGPGKRLRHIFPHAHTGGIHQRHFILGGGVANARLFEAAREGALVAGRFAH